MLSIVRRHVIVKVRQNISLLMIGNWLKGQKEIIERCKMKVTVENEFWELFPQAQISIMVVKGLDNSVDESKDPYFKSLLDKEAACRRFYRR